MKEKAVEQGPEVQFAYGDSGPLHDLIAGAFLLLLTAITVGFWGSRISEFSLITLAFSGGLYGLAKSGVPRIRCHETTVEISLFPGLSTRLYYSQVRQVRLVGESGSVSTRVITLLARSQIPPFSSSARPRLMLYLNGWRWVWFALPFPMLLPCSRIKLAFGDAPALYRYLTTVAGVECAHD